MKAVLQSVLRIAAALGVVFGVIALCTAVYWCALYWRNPKLKLADTERQETQRYINAHLPKELPKPAPQTGVMYVTLNAPCAKGSDAHRLVAQAILDKDQEAIEGLLSRGKIFVLHKGTRFDVNDVKDGVAWDSVRSGRNTGENCYIFSEVLSLNEVPLR